MDEVISEAQQIMNGAVDGINESINYTDMFTNFSDDF